MLKKDNLVKIVMILLLGSTHAICAQELKDPFSRDDDISLTNVTMTVDYNSHGHFVYTYGLDMSPESTGAVKTFAIDISCSTTLDALGFIVEQYPSSSDRSFSRQGHHVPVVVDAPYGQSFSYGIAEDNSVHWSMISQPGDKRHGLMLISPYPPGSRQYRLIPNMRYREMEYDYSGLDHDDEVPWTNDFTVTGLTTGPACPGEEFPDEGEPELRFAGSPFAGREPELRNELLTYSAPLRDQFHLEAGSHEQVMTIHYHADIDPQTFRVTPERNGLRRLFTPKPGTSETVRLPLDPGINRIALQVQARFEPPGQGAQPPQAVRGRGGADMDRDVFVIRVADAAEAGKGKGRPSR